MSEENNDPLDNLEPLISQEIPPGVDRRTFLMRSAVVGATTVMLGRSLSAHERTQRSIAPAPAVPALSDELNVVKKQKGPVMTTLDEFYKVGPGPSMTMENSLSSENSVWKAQGVNAARLVYTETKRAGIRSGTCRVRTGMERAKAEEPNP